MDESRVRFLYLSSGDGHNILLDNYNLSFTCQKVNKPWDSYKVSYVGTPQGCYSQISIGFPINPEELETVVLVSDGIKTIQELIDETGITPSWATGNLFQIPTEDIIISSTRVKECIIVDIINESNPKYHPDEISNSGIATAPYIEDYNSYSNVYDVFKSVPYKEIKTLIYPSIFNMSGHKSFLTHIIAAYEGQNFYPLQNLV